MLEVEVKAFLEGISPEKLEQRRMVLGFQKTAVLHERDVYYNGRSRDFCKTDEALRLRSCTRLPDGTAVHMLTYKSPKLDAVSNARREYEVTVSDGNTAGRLLEALDYQPAFTVEKVRREYRLNEVTLCVDEVTGLGRFLELEMLIEDEGDRNTAERQLLKLLDQLEVSRDRLTGTSYLELLMQQSEMKV